MHGDWMEKQGEIQSCLVEEVSDRRSHPGASIGIFSPVGDLEQLELFIRQVKRLGLDKDKNVDFLFIYRQGLKFPEYGLSALHVSEKCPIGTSGCFFIGQRLLYSLGYDVIVATDLDAELDSKATFEEMVKTAREKKKAVFPLSRFEENTSDMKGYNVNDWAVFPRNIFEQVGFSTPYMWRGGEEYELLTRLRSSGSPLEVFAKGYYDHPFVGFSIYHKLVERKKYYPYVAGILRAILFVSEYEKKAILKFWLWFVFYHFYADLLGDKALEKALGESGKFTILDGMDYSTEKNWFSISKVKEKGSFSNLSILRVGYLPASLVSLSISGSFDIYTDRVKLERPRSEFMLGIAKATFLFPLRLIQAPFKIASWKAERKKFVFPVFPNNAPEAELAFKGMVCKGGVAAKGEVPAKPAQ